LAKKIIDYVAYNKSQWDQFDWAEQCTMTAVKTSGMESLIYTIDSLSIRYKNNIEYFESLVDMPSFKFSRFYDGVDLYFLLKQLQHYDNDPVN